jgi:NAD(P)-dependent dehydrogenase (short-subunit alcohol dehydrogenase family)
VSTELGYESSARHLVEATVERFGRLDLLVANAGYARAGGLDASSWDSMQQAFAVMPMTFASMLRHALPALGRSPSARVVAVTSFVAQRFDGHAPFLETAAAKAALEAIAKSAAAELAPRGITVNCVAPGFTQKDRPSANQAAWLNAADVTPMGHVARPEEVAAAICFLLSSEAGHITGCVLQVDGGLTLL